MPLFRSSGGGVAFPRPPGAAAAAANNTARRAPNGGRSPSPPNTGGGAQGAAGGARGGAPPPAQPAAAPTGGAAPTVAEIESRIQRCRDALNQLSEFIKMDRSDDLCPMVDMLVNEAREEVSQMQQGGEACIAQDRFDLIEQITTIASEFEAIQTRAEAWKNGRGGGGGGAVGAGGSSARSESMSDDERMARDLAAKFEEEDRASAAGTPSNAAGRGAPPTLGGGPPDRFGAATSPGQVNAAPAGFPAWDADVDLDATVVARKKDKKKKKEAKAADAFGATEVGVAAGGGWPDVGAAHDASAVAFPSDFGDAFGSAPASDFPSVGAGNTGATAFPDFGAFGGNGGGFGDVAQAGMAGMMAPEAAFGVASSKEDFSAFSVDKGFPSPTAASAVSSGAPPPFDVGGMDAWRGPAAAPSHSSSPFASTAGTEPATLSIRRPYAEIADDVEGFTAHFVRGISSAMGIPEHRIRVRQVKPG